MRNKKLIVLIILAVGAVISLIYGILTPPATTRAVRPETQSPANQVETAQPVKTRRIVPLKRLSKKSEFVYWKRNPFVPVVSEKGSAYKPVLQGIMLYEDRPMATINEEIVTIGDKIGEYEVIEIKEKSVILSDGRRKLELFME